MKKTNVPGSQSFGQKLLQFIRNNTVPIMFILICLIPLAVWRDYTPCQ